MLLVVVFCMETCTAFILTLLNFLFVHLVFFQKAVFQGLSQEALSACIQSLLKASDIILKNKVGMQRRVCLCISSELLKLHFY